VAQELKVGVVIPNEKLQRALLNTLFSDSYKLLHNRNYSVLANPFNNQYQNCTEFVLDTIFSAIYKTTDTDVLKTNIKAYYTPHPIQVGSATLAMAASSNADVSLDDHEGPVSTTTFSTIAKFLIDNSIAKESFVYTVNPDMMYGHITDLEI
jgi:hypothetical protein